MGQDRGRRVRAEAPHHRGHRPVGPCGGRDRHQALPEILHEEGLIGVDGGGAKAHDPHRVVGLDENVLGAEISVGYPGRAQSSDLIPHPVEQIVFQPPGRQFGQRDTIDLVHRQEPRPPVHARRRPDLRHRDSRPPGEHQSERLVLEHALGGRKGSLRRRTPHRQAPPRAQYEVGIPLVAPDDFDEQRGSGPARDREGQRLAQVTRYWRQSPHLDAEAPQCG